MSYRFETVGGTPFDALRITKLVDIVQTINVCINYIVQYLVWNEYNIFQNIKKTSGFIDKIILYQD